MLGLSPLGSAPIGSAAVVEQAPVGVVASIAWTEAPDVFRAAVNVGPAPIEASIIWVEAPETISMSVTVGAPPMPVQFEPITLEQAKKHLRVVFNDDDDDIRGMIIAARQMLEGRINRALVPQVVDFTTDTLAPGLKLPRVPYLGGLTVSYRGAAGDLVPLVDHELDTTVEPAVLNPAWGQRFPSVLQRAGAVRIRYQAGYPDASTVPAPLKHWMLLAIGTMYEHRATAVVGVSVAQLPENFMQWLWQPYMVYV